MGLDLRKHLTRSLGAVQFLAVGVLLTAAAALLLPQVARASTASRDATLADCLRYLRTQIQVYAIEHNELSPGFAGDDLTQTPDSFTFLAQLTRYSDAYGRTSERRSESCALGPYLCDLPENPITLRAGVLVVVAQVMPSPDESQPYGWIYNPLTRQIIANVGGTDSEGMPYANY